MVRTSIPPHLSLDSFDPKLLVLLEKGTTGRQVIHGDPSAFDPDLDLEMRQGLALKQLRYMANRLNALRNALLKTDDDRAKSLYRTIVRVNPANLTLVVEPRDAQLGSLLAQIPDEPTQSTTSALDDLEAALGATEKSDG